MIGTLSIRPRFHFKEVGSTRGRYYLYTTQYSIYLRL